MLAENDFEKDLKSFLVETIRKSTVILKSRVFI
jgi:hypothetical protein